MQPYPCRQNSLRGEKKKADVGAVGVSGVHPCGQGPGEDVFETYHGEGCASGLPSLGVDCGWLVFGGSNDIQRFWCEYLFTAADSRPTYTIQATPIHRLLRVWTACEDYSCEEPVIGPPQLSTPTSFEVHG